MNPSSTTSTVDFGFILLLLQPPPSTPIAPAGSQLRPPTHRCPSPLLRDVGPLRSRSTEENAEGGAMGGKWPAGTSRKRATTFVVAHCFPFRLSIAVANAFNPLSTNPKVQHHTTTTVGERCDMATHDNGPTRGFDDGGEEVRNRTTTMTSPRSDTTTRRGPTPMATDKKKRETMGHDKGGSPFS